MDRGSKQTEASLLLDSCVSSGGDFPPRSQTAVCTCFNFGQQSAPLDGKILPIWPLTARCSPNDRERNEVFTTHALVISITNLLPAIRLHGDGDPRLHPSMSRDKHRDGALLVRNSHSCSHLGSAAAVCGLGLWRAAPVSLARHLFSLHPMSPGECGWVGSNISG